jgi:hypothetical protein
MYYLIIIMKYIMATTLILMGMARNKTSGAQHHTTSNIPVRTDKGKPIWPLLFQSGGI